jgi:hypothetical protein
VYPRAGLDDMEKEHLRLRAALVNCLCFVFFLSFEADDGGDLLLQNISLLLTDYMALYPRRQLSV